MNGIKKSVIERAKDDGVIERMNVLLSAAYLLNSETSLIMARCESMLERNGLLLGRIKMLTNRLNVAFDQKHLPAVRSEGRHHHDLET